MDAELRWRCAFVLDAIAANLVRSEMSAETLEPRVDAPTERRKDDVADLNSDGKFNVVWADTETDGRVVGEETGADVEAGADVDARAGVDAEFSLGNADVDAEFSLDSAALVRFDMIENA